MKNCCENHVDHALDVVVAESKTFPILEKLENENELSTPCDFCEAKAVYVVKIENDDTIS